MHEYLLVLSSPAGPCHSLPSSSIPQRRSLQYARNFAGLTLVLNVAPSDV